MNSLRFLISLSENDKRIIIALCILLILIFVIVGYLGLLVEKVMQYQGKKASTMMNNVVVAKVITTEKEFKKFGSKKNNRVLFKQARIPIIILFAAFLTYLITGFITNRWVYNLFEYKEGYGFGTICFVWDFSKAPHADFFGMNIISGWPPIVHRPEFCVTALGSYIIVPCLFVGGIWFLVVVQAHIARGHQIRKLAKKIFNPSLENVDLNSLNNVPINSQQNNVNNNVSNNPPTNGNSINS